uniref:Carboxylic ester hydrolase n=1 Tax=Caenorhabditis japonica TaxID=281687 RepID=A0A8R1DIG6_CAEJA
MGGHLSHLEREEHSNVLNATCGPIRGNVYRHGTKIVDGYLGIPYAKPPVGEQRFKKPVAADKWAEPRDCTKYGPRCPQSGCFPDSIHFEKKDVADEANCLTVNVFAPRWESIEFHSKRPVMVYIHGGGFECSASRDYCDYSISGTLPLKDVVVVTLNYRVGVLGFFSTGDSVCPGNFGLWDQTLALKWVKEHIGSFGGDSGNVTVLGQSAGAGSVDVLSLSPHSRDLFHRVIPMSGNAYCEFCVRTAKSQGNVCRKIARHLGYMGPDDSYRILEWMRYKPIEEIQKLDGIQLPSSGILAYVPCLDDDFIPKPLEELRKEAPKKSVMIGFAEYEGLFFDFLSKDTTKPKEALRAAIANYYKEDTGENFEDVRERIYSFYTQNIDENDDLKMKKVLIDFNGDSLFTAGTVAAAKSFTKYGNTVWFYIFDYCSPTGFGEHEKVMPFVAPTHCTDLRYILGEGLYSDFQPNEEELEMVDQMTTWYSNFAKYGNPNPRGSSDWEPYTLSDPLRHFHIVYPRGTMRNELHQERLEFLENIRKNNRNLETVIYGRS